MLRVRTLMLLGLVLVGSAGAKKSRGSTTIVREEKIVSLLGCPEGTREVGAKPPMGFEMWCSRTDVTGQAQRHGPSWMWWPDGRLRSTGSFLEGKRTGHWWFWTSEGTLDREGLFLDGVEEGYWLIYRPDGTISSEGTMRNGGRDGMWVTYDDATGRPQEGLWTLGEKDGVWIEYRDDDTPFRERVFRDGRLINQREF